MALQLSQAKHRIYEYVESRMSFIAPNLSVIVGASTAAKIMGGWGALWGEESPPGGAVGVKLLVGGAVWGPTAGGALWGGGVTTRG